MFGVWKTQPKLESAMSRKFAMFCCTLVLPALLMAGWSVVTGAEAQAASKKVTVAVMARPADGFTPKQVNWMQVVLQRYLESRPQLSSPPLATIEQTLYSTPVDASAVSSFQDRVKRIQKFLKKGKKLYHVTLFPLKKRSGYSLKILRKADTDAAELEKIFGRPDLLKVRHNLLRELYYYHALANLGLGNATESMKYMRKVIRMDPAFEPAKHRAPQDFVTVYSSVAGPIVKHRYSMKLGSVPSGAKVYHNNLFMGRTPMTLSGLVAGRHAIRLSKMKYTVWERVANLSPQKLGSRKVLNVKIPLKINPKNLIVTGIPLFDQGAEHSDDILDRLQQIVARLKVDFLYVIEPEAVQTKDKKTLFQLKIAIHKRGYRTLYYQKLKLGSSLRQAPGNVEAYSKKVETQTTSNFFKPPKAIK